MVNISTKNLSIAVSLMSVTFENIYGLFLYTIKVTAFICNYCYDRHTLILMAPLSQIKLLCLVPSVTDDN